MHVYRGHCWLVAHRRRCRNAVRSPPMRRSTDPCSMRRRTFIAGLGSAVAWPVVSWAQRAGKLDDFNRLLTTFVGLS